MTTPTRLQWRITECHKRLKRARFDGNELYMDVAEKDLNDLLDQLPRKEAQ